MVGRGIDGHALLEVNARNSGSSYLPEKLREIVKRREDRSGTHRVNWTDAKEKWDKTDENGESKSTGEDRKK